MVGVKATITGANRTQLIFILPCGVTNTISRFSLLKVTDTVAVSSFIDNIHTVGHAGNFLWNNYLHDPNINPAPAHVFTEVMLEFLYTCCVRVSISLMSQVF